MVSKLKYLWPSILWAAFIFAISMMPGKDLPKLHIINFDKLVHLMVYFIQAALIYWGIVKSGDHIKPDDMALTLIVVAVGIYGFIIEILQQTLTSDRQFDLYDALANLIGAIFGGIISHLYFNRSSRINLN